MTYPPQPGQWNPSAQPPGPPQPPPGYYPPPGWGAQPPPQNQGSGLKWLLIGVAVLLVIAITVGATLFFTRDGSGPGGTTSTALPPGAGDVASANDTGPVALITFDPTCAAWGPIQTALANTAANGWNDRDSVLESSSWTPQVRAQYEAVGASMRSAADQVVALAKQTPHRVMREMYEQFIAYGRAYADSLSSYEPKDDQLARANVNLHNAIGGVCNAIAYGGVAARTASLPVPPSPTSPPVIGDVGHPDRFVSGAIPSCSSWVRANSAFETDLSRWESFDRSVTAAMWDPDRRSVEEAAAQTFESYATTMERLGRQEKGTFEDLATLSALYMHAFASTIPNYTVPDSYVGTPGLRLNSAINAACKAGGGS